MTLSIMTQSIIRKYDTQRNDAYAECRGTDRNCLRKTNTLAYLSGLPLAKKKPLITSTPGFIERNRIDSEKN